MKNVRVPGGVLIICCQTQPNSKEERGNKCQFESPEPQKGVVPVVQPAVVATQAATWLLQLVQLESLQDPTSGNGDSYLAARPETIVLL